MPFEIPQRILDLNPRCVPIREGKKGPAVVGWPDTQARASDLDTSVFNHNKYGIVLDDDMLVVDVDVHDDHKNGYASLQLIKDDFGIDLYETAELIVKSPSGGAHLYFSKDTEVAFPKSTQDYPGLDFLSKGCQVIGPGSAHDSFDGVYEIIKDNMSEVSEIPSSLALSLKPQKDAVEPVKKVNHESPVDEFNRSERAVEIVKQELRSAGYTVITKGDGTAEFVRPGKTSGINEISGTVGLVSGNGNILLNNFSTNDPTGFPDDGSITLAHAYGKLKNIGWHQVPVDLRELGFGCNDEITDDEILEVQRSLGVDLEESYPTQTLEMLKSSAPDRRPYVIEGLLRRGETMNIIAAPKTGKSWFVYNLAATLATGGEFLGWTSPHNLKCMIVDNELHAEELAFRVSGVQEQLGVDFGDDLHFCCLRGASIDMLKLEEKLIAAGANRFDVIILDALYRFLPAGTSENDNAQMMLIYNTIDRIARTFDCSVICVHHSSKGSQNDKQVSDVGAGAGSISRAADTQIVLFPHATHGLVCIEAITRSSKTPEARSARLDGFAWVQVHEDAVRKAEGPDKESKKMVQATQNSLKRASRARKVGEWLESNDRIWPDQAPEVIGESKNVLRTVLKEHLVPAGVLTFHNFYYQRTEAWREKLDDFIRSPETEHEKEILAPSGG
jgi:peptidyl-tRNA hydrolase